VGGNIIKGREDNRNIEYSVYGQSTATDKLRFLLVKIDYME
jgi:hypothetical protein